MKREARRMEEYSGKNSNRSGRSVRMREQGDRKGRNTVYAYETK